MMYRLCQSRCQCYSRSTDLRYLSIALRCLTIVCVIIDLTRNSRPMTFTRS